MENSKYDAFMDEELIGLLRDGDAVITDYLLDKYKNMVRGKAQTMFLLGGETEDLIQEGMIGLFQAIRDYDYGRDASFRTFAELCVSRKMYNAIEKSRGQKHMPLNDYVSLYGELGENGSNQDLERYLTNNTENPEDSVIDRESTAKLMKLIRETLSDFERQAFELHQTGASSGEVARILGKSPKATDNAIQRARAKLKEALRGRKK